MKVFLTSLVAGLAALGALLTPAASVRAQTWTNHRLAEVTFEAPADWRATSTRDRAIIMADSAGRELRVEWWVQDEPILGYDDIVSHKRITVDGKRATWKHSSFPNRQTVTAVLDEKRKDGRQLLISLEAPGRDATAAIRLFDDILARVRFGGSASQSGAVTAPQGVAAVAPRQRERTPLSPQMQAIAAHFGQDCEAIALASWSHPALAAIRKRKQARLEWAMLCRNQRHPVFAMTFDYDPQGRTNDFFMPLYDDVLKAGGGAAFSFVSLRDKLIIDVALAGKDQIDVNFRDVPQLPRAENPGDSKAAPPDANPVQKRSGLPVREQNDARLFLSRASFSAPAEWEVRADPDQAAIGFIRPDNRAEIMVLLWPEARPMPSEDVKQLEHVVVADTPALRYRQRIANSEVEHIFFEDGYPDGSRISVSYRASGEPIEDGAPILELFLADLILNDSPPGGWSPVGPLQARSRDPYEGLDMNAFEKTR